jgi:hypothetical protein
LLFEEVIEVGFAGGADVVRIAVPLDVLVTDVFLSGSICEDQISVINDKSQQQYGWRCHSNYHYDLWNVKLLEI